MAERSSWFHDPERVRLRAESLGRAIRERRGELGLSRPELARRAGLSYPYVAELETGRKQGSPSTLHALASALDLETPRAPGPRRARPGSARPRAGRPALRSIDGAESETGEGPETLSMRRPNPNAAFLYTEQPLAHLSDFSVARPLQAALPRRPLASAFVSQRRGAPVRHQGDRRRDRRAARHPERVAIPRHPRDAAPEPAPERGAGVVRLEDRAVDRRAAPRRAPVGRRRGPRPPDGPAGISTRRGPL